MDYIIYHQVRPGTDCPDGIMAAAVTSMYLRLQGRDYELIGDSYRHADDASVSGMGSIFHNGMIKGRTRKSKSGMGTINI